MPFVVPEKIWLDSGNAGTQDATLTYWRGTQKVILKFRGGASQNVPTVEADIDSGRFYRYHSSVNQSIQAGDTVWVDKFEFAIKSSSAFGSAKARVTLNPAINTNPYLPTVADLLVKLKATTFYYDAGNYIKKGEGNLPTKMWLTVPAEIPVTEGNCGTGQLIITFTHDGDAHTVIYRGNPTTNKYVFFSSADGLQAGSSVEVETLEMSLYGSGAFGNTTAEMSAEWFYGLTRLNNKLQLSSEVRYNSTRRVLGKATDRMPITFKVPASLPVVQGNAGKRNAYLYYWIGTQKYTITYKGLSAETNSADPAQIAAGAQYTYQTMGSAQPAGAIVNADSLVLYLDNGWSAFGTTKVDVEMEGDMELRHSCGLELYQKNIKHYIRSLT